MDILDNYARTKRGRDSKKKTKKKKKKKEPSSWFESCNATQLKALCKAANQPVSGSKAALVERLIDLNYTRKLGLSSIATLKHQLKENLLVQSGAKYELVLRLLHARFGSGTAKRAATETAVDEETGESKEILKKHRVTVTPKALYTRVQKKIQAVSQKKYQSRFGSKDHAGAVYGLMKTLVEDHCIKDKEICAARAESLARAVFQAFFDFWQVMERPGYDTQDFREAVDAYSQVLEAARPEMSEDDVERVASLLESIEACGEQYCLNRRVAGDPAVYYTTGKGKTCHLSWSARGRQMYGGAPRHENENVIHEAIRLIMPDYDASPRDEKVGKLLNSEVGSPAWMSKHDSSVNCSAVEDLRPVDVTEDVGAPFGPGVKILQISKIWK